MTPDRLLQRADQARKDQMDQVVITDEDRTLYELGCTWQYVTPINDNGFRTFYKAPGGFEITAWRNQKDAPPIWSIWMLGTELRFGTDFVKFAAFLRKHLEGVR